MHYAAPFYHCHRFRIIQNFSQFFTHDARLEQAVEIKVVQFERSAGIDVVNSKRRAADLIPTANTAGQALNESRLAAAQVADQLNHFAALQIIAQTLGERQALF